MSERETDPKDLDIQDQEKPLQPLTAEEAEQVQGGITKVGTGTLVLSNSNLASDTSDPSRRSP